MQIYRTKKEAIAAAESKSGEITTIMGGMDLRSNYEVYGYESGPYQGLYEINLGPLPCFFGGHLYLGKAIAGQFYPAK